MRSTAPTRFAAPLLALALLVALPELVAACPVCFDQDDEARVAFLVTTGLLTFLPLGMVAGVIYWLRQRWKASQEDDGAMDPGAAEAG